MQLTVSESGGLSSDAARRVRVRLWERTGCTAAPVFTPVSPLMDLNDGGSARVFVVIQQV